MGERTVAQEALFYSFNLERHVPADHLLRSIDRFVDLSGSRTPVQFSNQGVHNLNEVRGFSDCLTEPILDVAWRFVRRSIGLEDARPGQQPVDREFDIGVDFIARHRIGANDKTLDSIALDHGIENNCPAAQRRQIY